MSGYSREEILGETHKLLYSGFHQKSFFKNLWQEVLSGNIWHGEICNRTKDGKEIWVDTYIFPLRKGDKNRQLQQRWTPLEFQPDLYHCYFYGRRSRIRLCVVTY